MATNNAMSNYLENKFLVDNFSGTKYIGLFTTNPDETNTGIEVVGGGYTRKEVTFSINGNQANNNEVLFPTATANWGELTHFGIYDTLNGNLLVYGILENRLNTPTVFSVITGDVFKFPINSLKITID